MPSDALTQRECQLGSLLIPRPAIGLVELAESAGVKPPMTIARAIKAYRRRAKSKLAGLEKIYQ
jgi:hypothetical protein